jgi:hypothetical protein
MTGRKEMNKTKWSNYTLIYWVGFLFLFVFGKANKEFSLKKKWKKYFIVCFHLFSLECNLVLHSEKKYNRFLIVNNLPEIIFLKYTKV